MCVGSSEANFTSSIAIIHFYILTTTRYSIFSFFSHDYVKMFLGESKVNEALSYGKNGKDCSIYYSSDICPWDTSAMIKIASKVMTSGNVDFASIATAAASRMFQSR